MFISNHQCLFVVFIDLNLPFLIESNIRWHHYRSAFWTSLEYFNEYLNEPWPVQPFSTWIIHLCCLWRCQKVKVERTAMGKRWHPSRQSFFFHSSLSQPLPVKVLRSEKQGKLSLSESNCSNYIWNWFKLQLMLMFTWLFVQVKCTCLVVAVNLCLTGPCHTDCWHRFLLPYYLVLDLQYLQVLCLKHSLNSWTFLNVSCIMWPQIDEVVETEFLKRNWFGDPIRDFTLFPNYCAICNDGTNMHSFIFIGSTWNLADRNYQFYLTLLKMYLF